MARTVAVVRFRISSPYLLKIRITILSNTEIRAGRFGVGIPVASRYFLQNRLYRLSGPPSLQFQWATGDQAAGCKVDHSSLARWILRMSGSIPLLPPVCFHDIDRDNFIVI
jgi:hypothetical protein